MPKPKTVWPLTVAAVAERLGVTERTVRNWINRGALKFEQVGGARLIYPEQLESPEVLALARRGPGRPKKNS